MIASTEAVFFSGSSPCKQADVIFPIGIEMANKLDKISICDTYGDHLENCINAVPTIVHNNVSETEKSLNISLKDETEKLNYLDHVYSKGIKQTFLTDGANAFYSSNFDFHYKVAVPKITIADSTGSGDAFVSGIAYGWTKKRTFEQQLRLAVSLGICNAQSFETCSF